MEMGLLSRLFRMHALLGRKVLFWIWLSANEMWNINENWIRPIPDRPEIMRMLYTYILPWTRCCGIRNRFFHTISQGRGEWGRHHSFMDTLYIWRLISKRMGLYVISLRKRLLDTCVSFPEARRWIYDWENIFGREVKTHDALEGDRTPVFPRAT